MDEGKGKNKSKGRPRQFDRELALRKALKIFWETGYEPASVAALCDAMGINPPSLYAAFGNKTRLYLEALELYEKLYWDAPARRLATEPDIRRALANYFSEAAEIILSPENPCGCMAVVATVNVSGQETEIIERARQTREDTKKMFAERLRVAIKDGQIPADADVPAIAGALNSMLEGLSLQARSGIFLSELKAMAALAVRILPDAPTPDGAALP